ncbi:helix-turn-helix transcriptional regulator [Neglectibacter timonensis]
MTARDKEALLLICLGNSQKFAAEKMGISQQAVNRHLKKIKNILQKGV